MGQAPVVAWQVGVPLLSPLCPLMTAASASLMLKASSDNQAANWDGVESGPVPSPVGCRCPRHLRHRGCWRQVLLPLPPLPFPCPPAPAGPHSPLMIDLGLPLVLLSCPSSTRLVGILQAAIERPTCALLLLLCRIDSFMKGTERTRFGGKAGTNQRNQ